MGVTIVPGSVLVVSPNTRIRALVASTNWYQCKKAWVELGRHMRTDIPSGPARTGPAWTAYRLGHPWRIWTADQLVRQLKTIGIENAVISIANAASPLDEMRASLRDTQTEAASLVVSGVHAASQSAAGAATAIGDAGESLLDTATTAIAWLPFVALGAALLVGYFLLHSRGVI